MDRPRCAHCRNPIRPSHATAGPAGTYHEDCWTEMKAKASSPSLEQQREYQRRIAAEGLAALLSPYVSDVPEERDAPSVGV